MDIKDMLYKTLDEIGKIKIRTDLQKDLFSSKTLIDEIISKIVMEMKNHIEVNSSRLVINPMEFNYSFKQQLSVLCESLLHYFLTASTIPSSRKVSIKNQELDIVIPDIRTLKIAPANSLIIKFSRGDCISFDFIDDIFKIQPYEKNIWIVSPIQIASPYKNYILYSKMEFENFLQEKENLNSPKFYNHSMNEQQNYVKITDLGFYNFYSFSNIILDIEQFLKDSNNRSFRFFHV